MLSTPAVESNKTNGMFRFMMAQAQYYRNEKIRPMIDEKYGEGAYDFFARAIESFYTNRQVI